MVLPSLYFTLCVSGVFLFCDVFVSNLTFGIIYQKVNFRSNKLLGVLGDFSQVWMFSSEEKASPTL